MFKRNEGILDRSVRVLLGLVLLPVGLFVLGGLQGNVAGIISSVIGTIALITGFTGVCPLYIPFGISTLAKEQAFMAKCASMASTCMQGWNSDSASMCWPGSRTTKEPQSSPE